MWAVELLDLQKKATTISTTVHREKACTSNGLGYNIDDKDEAGAHSSVG